MNKIYGPALSLAVLLGAFGSLAAEAGTNVVSDAHVFLDRLLERAKVEGKERREFKAHYAYTGSKVTEHRTSKGKLKHREVEPIEHNPKPLATRASQRVSDSADRRDGATADQGLRQDAQGDVKGRAFERSDFPLTADLLKRFQFAAAGKEILNGRSVLIIDFKPASGDLPVHSIKDRFINKAAGRVWIDEMEFALVKVDLHLTESVNVIGGLVGAVRQCNYQFERERTPDGLWFTKQVNWHLEGRQVFVNKTIDYHEMRENVRKVW